MCYAGWGLCNLGAAYEETLSESNQCRIERCLYDSIYIRCASGAINGMFLSSFLFICSARAVFRYWLSWRRAFLLRFIKSAQHDERLRVLPANQERELPLPVSGRYSNGFSHSASIIHPWSLHSNGVPHATGLAADGGRAILTVLVPRQLSAHWLSWSVAFATLYGDSETELNFFFLLTKP